VSIVHVVQALDVGGLENGLVNIVNHLDDDFTHTILCLSRSGRMAERIKNPRAQVIEMRLPTDRFRFPVLRLAREFRRLSPDIVHTRGWSTVDAICAARVAGVEYVIHGEHGREAGDPNGGNRKRNLVRKWLAPLVNRFVTVSDDLRSWLIQTVGIPTSKITTIHNGVDSNRFAAARRPSSRALLGFDDALFTLGTVGRLDPVKDHATLIKAFLPIAQSQQPTRLIIAGDGPARSTIERLGVELKIADKIQLLGERHDIPEVLQACDVFTLTSIAEGISNTILEAMASALPVVATRVGGNPELVDDGLTGYLVEARDVTGLTAAFETYLQDQNLRNRHGQNARARVLQKFSLEGMATQYARLYNDVIGDGEEKAA
jgi:sugar transferase (PEP-CTERM/EpsH1 system associated)